MDTYVFRVFLRFPTAQVELEEPQWRQTTIYIGGALNNKFHIWYKIQHYLVKTRIIGGGTAPYSDAPGE